MPLPSGQIAPAQLVSLPKPFAQYNWPVPRRTVRTTTLLVVPLNIEPPLVSAFGGSLNFQQTGAQCWSGIRFHNTGAETSNNFGGSSDFSAGARGDWLDQGVPGAVWIERTINSGSFNLVDPGAGRLNLSSTREFSMTRASLGIQSCNVTFDFYDAASGGSLLDTTTGDFTAEWV